MLFARSPGGNNATTIHQLGASGVVFMLILLNSLIQMRAGKIPQAKMNYPAHLNFDPVSTARQVSR